MIVNRRGLVFLPIILALVLCTEVRADQGVAAVAAERDGIDLSAQAGAPSPGPRAATLKAIAAIPAGGLLLIPESTNDRVMAFDPVTGNLVNADFIPADPTHLDTPIHALLSAAGDSILVSDQIEDVVQRYDLAGNYLGVFAPAGGADTSILDNIRGMSLRPNGNLLVTVGGGANDDAVAEFDTSGNYLGNFVANGSGGLDSPFDVLLRGGDYLVGGISSDQIHSYGLTGSPNANFAPINTFPEQLALAGNGNVLVANFSGTQEGVVEFDSAGGVIGVYDPPSLGNYRGVYELPNGNILTTNGNGVHEIDRAGNLVQTKLAGVSARFITYLLPASAPRIPIPLLSPWLLVVLGSLLAAGGFYCLRRRILVR